MGETKKITDLETVRMITHPVRVRIYELLTAYGPSTATQLSKRMDVPTNALSYHLRQLAAYGYAEEAEDLKTDGRERWWRAVPGGLHWSEEDFPESEGTRAVLSAAERAITNRRLKRLHDWQQRGQQEWGQEWVSASRSSDSLLHLDQQELRQLGAEIDEVVERWAERSRAARALPSTESDDRATVFCFYHAFPLTDERPQPH